MGKAKKICDLLKREIIIFNDYVTSYEDTVIERVNLQTRTDGLYKTFDKFNEIQTELDLEIAKEISDQFFSAIARRKFKILSYDSSAPSTSSSYQHSVVPIIEIPHFSGCIEDWAKYKKKFEQIIHSNSKLSDTQKLQYLKSYLHGEAANAVNGRDYNAAWKYLLDKYDSKRDLILRHSDLLLKTLPMPDDSPQSMSDLATDMNDHVHRLRDLSQSWSNIADYLLTSIAVSRMEESVRQRWEQKFTEMPSTFSETCKFLRQEHPYSPETHRRTRNRPYRPTSPSSKRPRHQL